MTGKHRKPWVADESEDEFFERDPRPIWERMDPADGVPPWEALFHFVRPRLAEMAYELDLAGYGDEANIDPMWDAAETLEFQRNHARFRLRLLDLRAELLGKLLRGEVIARGYSSQAPLDAPRQAIRADRWRDLEIDIRRATASGPGVEVTQILIFPAHVEAGDEKDRAKGFSSSALRKWYNNRVEQCASSGRQPSREEDHQEANEAFHGAIPKRAVEALRRELAPEAWKRKGRRPKKSGD
ncbi:hypothetical protein FQ775_00950 [Nitratireductor mangrovi]|uniref:Uncharacterized protein n=1 Tax=Nitratireductor mangrovi TaxID=2599600 RepID=A0A5B8KTZ2_9HYPH|nr:hypothetical protein [Nitratireductor mangrovi]QDY99051.1 hypothetical protein FQ775_00950 [Nitratireductor mangrovi]